VSDQSNECYCKTTVIVQSPVFRPTIVLPLACCPVDNTLLEVGPEICYFRCVKSLLLLWKPRSWF